MEKYVELKEYYKYMNLHKGDIVFISSDAKKMIWEAVQNRASMELNDFIDGIIEGIGTEGTLIFPTYNWDFCGGNTFDYKNTPCKTGSLGTIALKRNDFKRTKHPIYSFAVYGKYQEELCQMDNIDSFGLNSPFAFFKEQNVKNYMIDVPIQHCFTFVHFVEQQSGVVEHRFIKEFTAKYIDEYRNENERTYSMFVRDLDKDVIMVNNLLEEDFVREGIETQFEINHSHIKQIHLGDAYDIVLRDILENRSRKICTYKGQ